MMQSSSFSPDIFCTGRNNKQKSFSFDLKGVLNILVLSQDLFQCPFGFLHLFLCLPLPALFLRSRFLVQMFPIFLCGPVMNLLEVLRHINKHIVQIVSELFAPFQVFKPVLCHIAFSLDPRIFPLSIAHAGISPASTFFSERIFFAFSCNVFNNLVQRCLPVRLLQQIRIAAKRLVIVLQLFSLELQAYFLRHLQKPEFVMIPIDRLKQLCIYLIQSQNLVYRRTLFPDFPCQVARIPAIDNVFCKLVQAHFADPL